jgi:Zn-dependent protease
LDQYAIYFLYVPALLLALVLHELAHALVAYWGGDDTAALQGRITLNPVAHIDPIGTILLPAILILSGSSFLFGWAKPVPVNPTRLKNSRWNIWVSLAGPMANLLLIVASAIALKIFYVGVGMAGATIAQGSVLWAIEAILGVSLVLNLVLMLFNLLPIPPLDGSHIALELFFKHNETAARMFSQVGMFGMILIVLLMRPMSYLFIYGLYFLNAILDATLGIEIPRVL